MNNKKTLDTSQELFVFRLGNGITLGPINHEKNQKKMLGQSIGRSVGDLLRIPNNIYFLNGRSEGQNASDTCLEHMGVYSLKEIIGKTIRHVSPEESAMKIINNDKTVFSYKKPKLLEEQVIRKDGQEVNLLTLKMPWYNADRQIVGVFGYSISLEKNQIASSISQILQLGLLQPESLPQQYLSGREINGVYLTKKEVEMLYQMVRGKTAKTIAKMYGISYRTIEERIQNVKQKFGVSSKSELIDQVVDSFIQ